MSTAEAIAVIERFAPKPAWAPPERNWPLAIITACGNVDRQLVGANLDLVTEAISVLTGIPFVKLLTAAEVVEATPPLPPALENQGGS